MTSPITHTKALRLSLAAGLFTLPLAAEPVPAAPAVEGKPAAEWPVHSMKRPRPEVVSPAYDGVPVPAPAGALILFDGKDLSKWAMQKKDPTGGDTAKWMVAEGHFQVVPGTGTIGLREPLKGDLHLHVEWATPAEVKGNGQGRGNSGLFISGFPEVQILDSWQNDTYPDGQAGAFYGKRPPLVNASRGPGEWQCYDVLIERAKVEDGKVVRKARLTVRHNNVLVQDKVEFDTKGDESTLTFQDHGNPMRFRNIWAAPLSR